MPEPTNVRGPAMRIVLAPSAYYPHIGGIEELTRQLALVLQARGHHVRVLTNRWPEGAAAQDVLDGVSIARLAFPLPAARPANALRFLVTAPGAALEVIRFIRREEPDVVHVIGAGPQSAYLGLLAPFLRTPLVFTAQGELTFDAQGAFARSTTLRVALRRVLRRADAVTACSSYVLRELTAFGPITATSVVIPNGVNPSDFSEVDRTPGSVPYILAVGRLVPQKGFDVLIQAFADERLASLQLLIAGEGFERERLMRLAESMGIESRVRFLGPVNRQELAGLLAGACAFALPSRGEPFGIALLEAMAAGIPSVATRAGGVTDFARDGENALLVPPDDAGALSHALERLMIDKPLRARLVHDGRATAKRLTWMSIAAAYERLYTHSAHRTRTTPQARIPPGSVPEQ